MASWKKYFSNVPSQSRLTQNLENAKQRNPGVGSGSKYSSYLPEVYSGAPNRVERYVQYESMDLDSEIRKGLDIIADYSVQNYSPGEEAFNIVYKTDMTETEIELLTKSLSQWSTANKWQQRLWRTFRNLIKYGDQIFIRDPETFKLIHIPSEKVEKIIVEENKGKEIEQYVIRDMDLNLATLVGTNMLVHDQYSFPGGYPRSANPGSGAGTVNYGVGTSPGSRISRFDMAQNNFAIDATHVIHLSLSEGMDSQWPFGTSLLEGIYKVWKQKDLLEDSIIIYRIVRAPERRVFYIDTGSLSGPRAQAVVERMKNEIYQRRIPNRTGGGQSIVDAAYSPLAINEDYFLSTNSEGKGTRIETLQGGDNLGQIDDLRYFNNKLVRGLSIPSSYLPTGPDDGTTPFTDGKVGTAYVQEFAFSKFCQRLQGLLSPVLDKEFKLYVKNRGIDIPSSAFELQFWEPQNFSKYKQMAINSEQIGVFTSLMTTDAAKYISKRFALMKYLGWSEEDILKNEGMYKEENAKRIKSSIGISIGDEDAPGLRSVGVRPTMDAAVEPEGDDDTQPGEEGGQEGEDSAVANQQPAAGPVTGGGGTEPGI